MERTRVIVTRHGPTEWNLRGLLQGDIDIPLSENAIPEIKVLVKSLIEHNVTAIYTSPLARTHQTAEIIGEEIGIDKISVSNDLRERNVGPFQGQSKRDLPKSYQDIGLDHFFAQAEIEDAEPPKEFAKRTLKAIKQIAQNHPNETILVITHGGNIRAILDSQIKSDMEIPQEITNNSLYVLEVCDDSIRLLNFF